MKLTFSAAEEEFRCQARDWLHSQLVGEFADIRHLVGLTAKPERRKEWEQRLGEDRWSVIGWPEQWGGRNASLMQQVIFAEEYARSGAPGRIGHLGVELAGPTILTFGTQAQKARFLPDIAAGNTLWCQGYSEPNAGSDLANIHTKAHRDATTGDWIIKGQKIWTSLAHICDWIFTVVRSEEGSQGPKGLTFLLVPLDQPEITIRPIQQINGSAEFAETFFDGARTAGDNLVAAPGDGWRVAMGLLAFERGVSTLGQQMGFRNELDGIITAAKANGAAMDPLIRQRLAKAEIGLRLMRYGALRILTNSDPVRPDGAALTYKIQWASWRRDLGELAMDVLGQAGEVSVCSDGDCSDAEWGDGTGVALANLLNLFLYSRADTIYGGTNQIQRNIIAERALGLPREPRGTPR